MEYDVNFFINHLDSVPENEWGEGSIMQKCAIYHCDRQYNYDGVIAQHLKNLFNDSGVMFRDVTAVNDGIHFMYKQSTPKQRVMAALYDIRDKQIEEANLKPQRN